MSLEKTISQYLIESRTRDNLKTRANVLVEETLDELSKETLANYIQKAVEKNYIHGMKDDTFNSWKRERGVSKALKKLKEDLEFLSTEDLINLYELSKDKLTSYARHVSDGVFDHNGNKNSEKRLNMRKLALKKIWSDPKYGFPDEVKVPADGKFPSGHRGKGRN